MRCHCKSLTTATQKSKITSDTCLPQLIVQSHGQSLPTTFSLPETECSRKETRELNGLHHVKFYQKLPVRGEMGQFLPLPKHSSSDNSLKGIRNLKNCFKFNAQIMLLDYLMQETQLSFFKDLQPVDGFHRVRLAGCLLCN